MTTPSAPLPTRELERVTPPFEPSLVEELSNFRQSSAGPPALHPNNPVYKSAQTRSSAGFVPVWKRPEELMIPL